jgi:hypothetical protein
MPESNKRLRQRVELEIAPLRDATRLIVDRHYLHRGRTMAQLPYWINLDGDRRGVMLFSLPRLSVPFQGYHPMTLIELARLWVDPAVQGKRVMDTNGVQHAQALAGCAVAAALRRVQMDWTEKYPNLPRLEACVAWSDNTLHRGTVYRATNFREVGRSGGKLPGRSRGRRTGSHLPHTDYTHPKTAFLFVFDKKGPDTRPGDESGVRRTCPRYCAATVTTPRQVPSLRPSTEVGA